jgi:hypothetical protein
MPDAKVCTCREVSRQHCEVGNCAHRTMKEPCVRGSILRIICGVFFRYVWVQMHMHVVLAWQGMVHVNFTDYFYVHVALILLRLSVFFVVVFLLAFIK